MRIKAFWLPLVTIACICFTTNLAAKSAAVDNGYYTTKDKEFYMTPEDILFIRPGLEIEILEVVLPTDMQLEVTYSIKDPAGMALDHDGVNTPGEVDMRFTLANIPIDEEQKVRLAYEDIDADSGRRPTGILTSLGDGMYKYKFDTAVTSGLDTTHTLVLGGRRDLREFDLDRYAANDIHDWVPSGMYDAVPRDIVTTATCNRCHDPLAQHGSRWLSPAACGQCHNPELVDDGISYSLDVMVHRVHKELEEGYPPDLNECQTCHTGGTPTENFPMVAIPAAALVCDSSGNGEVSLTWEYTGSVEIHVRNPAEPTGKLFAAGGTSGSTSTGKWVRDGTVFDLYDAATQELIQSVPVNATVLGCISNPPGAMRGEAGAQHTNWMDHPSRAVCGSCHDYINWETGEGHSDFNIVQPDDSKCGNCHEPIDGEFDRSVTGAHLELYKSAQLPGYVVEFIEITNTNPGDKPTVTFSLGGKNAKYNPADMNRLRFVITGPNEDFSYYVREDVGSEAIAKGEGTWNYTFNTALPMDAEGSYTISMEGRIEAEVDFGNEVSTERDYAENPYMAFAVTDATVMQRRKVVDDAKCENCHANLRLHGGNRHDPQYCNTCHTPDLVDIATPAESVHMKWMTHKIHRGEALENGYIVVRSRGTYDFSNVEYPGDLRNCDACHVNNSQQLPVYSDALPTITNNAWWTPMEPQAAACLSCHDGDDAAAHAYSNTTFFGESCSTCHGEGKSAAVDKVHAR